MHASLARNIREVERLALSAWILELEGALHVHGWYLAENAKYAYKQHVKGTIR
ncbi:hypothetical protein B0T26DRAFT_710993 [Lasiosphaeria miniovina]|uniref:Uncharacterized protein n=1 Tax=Lasiosphaeria miniovina TaxID=1954250 RepID=A0AA40AL58_9PEZI|nr:uncharacterized protein B0T26DRAFT_710993 [Lasiosphaeria miniovina]KAK0717849.1 hypothetical protein B0T26DRAFT_710993 [Lasiosphaeria miniovina]